MLRALRQNHFIRHNAINFVGSLFIGLLNYLYYPVLGRVLEPAVFGEVQTLVSLFLQITTFLSVLGLLAVNIVTNYDDERRRNRVILELEKLGLFISAALLLLTILGGRFLQHFFHFGSWLPFLMLALAVTATVPFTFRTSYLRGKKYFGLHSVAWIVGAASKLGLSLLFVWIGWGTTGAILGLVVAQLLSFAYAAHTAEQHGFTERLRGQLLRLPNLKLVAPELKYALLVLSQSLTITILYSIDIVVVKHYFDATTAGLYASIATVSRILFFLTASVSQVLMPSVKLRQSAEKNLRVLVKSFVLVLAGGGAALAVFCLAPRFVVALLMGNTYLPYARLLPRLSLAIFVVSVLNLLLTYYVALRHYTAGVIAVGGAILTYTWMLASHHTLEAVVNSLLFSSLTTTTVMIAWMTWITVNEFRKKGRGDGQAANLDYSTRI